MSIQACFNQDEKDKQVTNFHDWFNFKIRSSVFVTRYWHIKKLIT